MKTYYDNFNLVSGYTCRVTDFLTIGRHTLQRRQTKRDNQPLRTDWLHVMDTRDAKYPSLACVMGASSFSFCGRPLPIIFRFLRAAVFTR